MEFFLLAASFGILLIIGWTTPPENISGIEFFLVAASIVIILVVGGRIMGQHFFRRMSAASSASGRLKQLIVLAGYCSRLNLTPQLQSHATATIEKKLIYGGRLKRKVQASYHFKAWDNKIYTGVVLLDRKDWGLLDTGTLRITYSRDNPVINAIDNGRIRGQIIVRGTVSAILLPVLLTATVMWYKLDPDGFMRTIESLKNLHFL